jgi:hypothetical protein
MNDDKLVVALCLLVPRVSPRSRVRVIGALLQADIRVFLVTHVYDLTRGFQLQRLPHVLFLRADRRADGSRTFRVVGGEPLPTSYGSDLYERIFGGGRVAGSTLPGAGA